MILTCALIGVGDLQAKNLLLYCLIPLLLPRLFLNFSLFYTRDVNFYDGETFSVLSLNLLFAFFHCIAVFFQFYIKIMSF